MYSFFHPLSVHNITQSEVYCHFFTQSVLLLQHTHLQAAELITLALTLLLLLHSLPTCRRPQLTHLQTAELITLALTLDLAVTLADEQYMLMRS
jgi:adenylosuccinate lyase